MERFWLMSALVLSCFNLSRTFILPLRNTNGSLDVEHLVGHVISLEQTITGFQQTIKSQDADIVTLQTEIVNMKAGQHVIADHGTDITTLKNEISHLKANQQVITSHHADIAVLKTEIVNLKANQQKLDNKIFDLQKLFQPGQISAEVTSLKSEVNAAKTEVTHVSNEVISLTFKYRNLTQNYQSLSSQMKSEVNVVKTEVTQVSNEVMSLASKFGNLTQGYETLSVQMKPNQNLTKTVHAVQDTLSRVLSHVHSAENDRFLLHSSVNKLNKTVTELRSNLSVTTTSLTSEIAEMKMEVGFNIWLGPDDVTLQVSSWTTLKFHDIQYNKGDGYNASTGVFTVPVSGTYLFWTQITKPSGSRLELFMKKGNSDIGYFHTPTSGGWVTGSVITTADVTAGEQVYVVVKGADSAKHYAFSRFGGALLFRH